MKSLHASEQSSLYIFLNELKFPFRYTLTIYSKIYSTLLDLHCYYTVLLNRFIRLTNLNVIVIFCFS